MQPLRLRILAVLIAATLAAGVTAAVRRGEGFAATSRAPVAAPAGSGAATGSRPSPRPSPTRRAPTGPVAVGEPAGSPAISSGISSSGPSWLEAAHPAQFNAVRSPVRGGNAWALLIGINAYRSPTRDNVGSYQDAVSLRQYLLHLGWRDDHILLLGNLDATRDHVVQGLQWLASKTDANSMAVFHYSGHEMPFYNDPDGDGESIDVGMWVSDNQIILDRDLGRLLDPVRASKFWLDFAVCRAAGFNDPGTIKQGRLLTYSSPVSELSYEDPSLSHSVFGYYSIVQGLQGANADANGDGVTTVQEAFDYAKPRVANRTDDRQHPVMVDRYGSGFSLVPPAPPPPPRPAPSPSPSPATPGPCILPIGCTRQTP